MTFPMKLSDFDYNLPQELIAQEPASPRDSCRLLVLDKKTGAMEHRHFFEIGDYLKEGDLLVINNTKVFKARLFGELDGKKIEIFLVRPEESGWLALGKPGRRLKVGETVKFADDFFCKILSKNEAGELSVDFSLPASRVIELANQYGHIPVPPYIKKEPAKTEEYQTVYADEQKIGSVAAPTAGFHFTENLISKLEERGIGFVEITLHVGLGTFLPIRADEISNHKMHSEWVEIYSGAAEKINAAKKEGRRVIAIGTTTTRALEGVAVSGGLRGYSGFVDIFIQPGFDFKIIDGLITNFHLPKSTLLVLVSAFAGRENILRAYEEAVKQKYNFYSFGDAMLIF
jgi:S-adenosylmethionine:tRNA ribosyltransferase-isomerase